MRNSRWFWIAALAALCPTWALADGPSGFKTPIDAAQVPVKLNPGYRRPDLVRRHSEAEQRDVALAVKNKTLKTLPYWQGSFQIKTHAYTYSILGTDPAKSSAATVIHTILVPIVLTVPDVTTDGVHPVVFDGTGVMDHVLGSPIFRRSNYVDGKRQWGDAMLRVEFPTAHPNWRLVLSPTIGPVLAITAPPGTVSVYRTKAGVLLGVVNDDSVFDEPILAFVKSLKQGFDKYPIFVSANVLENDAFGYHDATFEHARSEQRVFAYTSWLEGVDELFTTPSPDADTMSHEVAETIHDAFLGTLASLTRVWGDAFAGNACFQSYIEVGDAIEDAPASIQNFPQPVMTGGKVTTYTLQDEALLPWFERQSPSSSLNGAYSFPDTSVLTAPAPMNCVLPDD